MSDAMWDSDPVWVERKERERKERWQKIADSFRRLGLTDYFDQSCAALVSEPALEGDPAVEQ